MFLGLFVASGTGNWKDFPIFLGFPVVLLTWVHAFKLEVSDGVLSYSSLFSRKRPIQLSAIENADTQFGPDAPFGPFYRLVVYPHRRLKRARSSST